MKPWIVSVVIGTALLQHAPAENHRDRQQAKVDAAHASELAEAQKAAMAWLALLDSEKYAACWSASSTLFRTNVPEAAWEQRMTAVRKPLDPLVNRTLNTAQYKTELPGLPRGVYAALVWETIFSDNHSKLESVVMQREGSDWLMAGYAVQ